MKNMDEMKLAWQKESGSEKTEVLNPTAFENLIRMKIRKENSKTLHYFWAAFVYQNLIYGLTAALIVKNFSDYNLWIYAFLLSLVYIPFTVVMMNRFKKINGNTAGTTLTENLQCRYDQLGAFFRFKKVYEVIAVPAACAMITVLVFKLWIPGDWKTQIPELAGFWVLALGAFAWAILRENRHNFSGPLKALAAILDDLKQQ